MREVHKDIIKKTIQEFSSTWNVTLHGVKTNFALSSQVPIKIP